MSTLMTMNQEVIDMTQNDVYDDNSHDQVLIHRKHSSSTSSPATRSYSLLHKSASNGNAHASQSQFSSTADSNVLSSASFIRSTGSTSSSALSNTQLATKDKMNSIYTYTLRGICVEFPFPAYECQLVFMERVIEALQTGNNALLESPTGTGKTLCLLCATLAWRKHTIQEMENQLPQQQHNNTHGAANNGGGGNEHDIINNILHKVMPNFNANSLTANGGEFIQNTPNHLSHTQQLSSSSGNTIININNTVTMSKPKIIYASRTHSQLTQVVDELKHTSYKPAMTLLGSRQQLCVHPEVSKLQGTVQNHACAAKTTARTCKYRENLNGWSAEKHVLRHSILDIEDLVSIGKSENICPYYWQMDNRNDADILFMPYNYLLSSDIRTRLNLQLNNAIIIFDEAHNLESICSESSSFDLTANDLATSLAEIDACVKIAVANANVAMSTKGPVVLEELAYLKRVLLKLEEIIHFTPIKENENGVTYEGEHIFEILQQCEVNFDNMEIVNDLIERTIDALFATNVTATDAARKSLSLDKIQSCLNIIFRKSDAISRSNSRYYKIHIHKPTQQQQRLSNAPKHFAGMNSSQASSQPPINNSHTLSYWCFFSGLSMSDLMQCHVRSIILASGTLSPMQSYAHELAIPFNIRLENPHVITDEQVFVTVVDKGPTNCILNSSYSNRNNNHYMSELGNAIINISRIVPDGVLVFFPSYTAMQVLIDSWKVAPAYNKPSILERIQQRKHVVLEPRNSNEFQKTIDEYHDKLGDPNMRGCVLFAVCRGKVSEGLDFADRYGRAVIVTGIPYPNLKDPKVVLKREFCDKTRKVAVNGISGDEWYTQQAARALNQAIGRVIRHRKDYGAIILLDERFSYANTKNSLSMWLRPRIEMRKNFGEFTSKLIGFFKIPNRYDPRLPSQQELMDAKKLEDDERQFKLSFPKSQSQSQSMRNKYDNNNIAEYDPDSIIDELDENGNRIENTPFIPSQLQSNRAVPKLTQSHTHQSLFHSLNNNSALASTSNNTHRTASTPSVNGNVSTLFSSLTNKTNKPLSSILQFNISTSVQATALKTSPSQSSQNSTKSLSNSLKSSNQLFTSQSSSHSITSTPTPTSTPLSQFSSLQNSSSHKSTTSPSLPSLLRSVFTPNEYQDIKDCVFALSKLRQNTNVDKNQQLQTAQRNIEKLKDFFHHNESRQYAGHKLKNSLPVDFRKICETIWKLHPQQDGRQQMPTDSTTQSSTPLSSPAPLQQHVKKENTVSSNNSNVKEYIEIDDDAEIEVSIVGQPIKLQMQTSTATVDTIAQSTMTALEREKQLQAVKREFLVDLKDSFRKQDYEKFKSLIISIEAISPAMNEKDTRIVIKPLFTELLQLFNSTTFGWKFAERYKQLCYDRHSKFYNEIFEESLKKRESRNTNRMTNGTSTHIDVVTGMKTASSSKRIKT